MNKTKTCTDRKCLADLGNHLLPPIQPDCSPRCEPQVICAAQPDHVVLFDVTFLFDPQHEDLLQASRAFIFDVLSEPTTVVHIEGEGLTQPYELSSYNRVRWFHHSGTEPWNAKWASMQYFLNENRFQHYEKLQCPRENQFDSSWNNPMDAL